jgi:hypothetical protein
MPIKIGFTKSAGLPAKYEAEIRIKIDSWEKGLFPWTIEIPNLYDAHVHIHYSRLHTHSFIIVTYMESPSIHASKFIIFLNQMHIHIFFECFKITNIEFITICSYKFYCY